MVARTREHSKRVRHYNQLHQTLYRLTHNLDDILVKVDHGGRLSLHKLLKVMSKLKKVTNAGAVLNPEEQLDLQNLFSQVQCLSTTHLMDSLKNVEKFQEELKYVEASIDDHEEARVLRKNKK